jgi:CelD/BcsL family acetyltransferase involved in cellulose biosynthesis
MKVTVVQHYGDFMLLESRWNALVDSLEHPAIYLTHTWMRLWWEHFHGQDSLYIFLVWEEGDLVGILPLRRMFFRRFKLLHVPGFSFLTNPNNPSSNIICSLQKLPKVVKAICDHLECCKATWDRIEMKNVPSDSGTVTPLVEGLAGAKSVAVVSPWQEKDGAYYLEIHGSFSDYFKSLSPSFRQNRRYIHNVMVRNAKVEFTVEKEYDPTSLRRLYDIEDTGWKHAKGKPLKTHGVYGSYFIDMAKQFANLGWLRICSLRYAGEIIAMVYGLVFRDTFYFIKLAVDYDNPATRRIGPGQVIQYYLLQHCFESGYRKSDFFGGCDPYEAHWTKMIDRRVRITIYNQKGLLQKAWFYFWESAAYYLRVLRIASRADQVSKQRFDL